MFRFLAVPLLLAGAVACSGGESGAATKSTGGDADVAEIKSIPWVTSYKEALEQAKKEKKPILLDLFTDWCGWCKKMDASTYTDPDVIAISRKMVFLKLNAEKDPDGIELQNRMSVFSFPTTMVLDAGGEEVDRIPGYLTAEAFVKSVDRILNDKESIPQLKKMEAENNKDADILYKLGRRYYEKDMFEQAKVRFDRIIELDPQNKAKRTDESYFLKALCSANLGQMNEALALLERFRTSFPDSQFVPESELVYGEILMKTRRDGEAKKVFQQFLRKYPKHRMADEVRQMIEEL